ncbi:hypothetical protein VCRLGP8_640046 [Vibrio crassostreae]|nr:hypothetical protein VCRA2119O381_30115 [Vibrio crassostreae]CAK2189898.1 hypothetical protein VCRA2113O354_60186 [Vibrio crassostreae]CAK2558374.1 hypothetical protein VCRA2114E366_70185 [Vibrio crassostreae]CAK3573967.1 hypothetical protein VCRA2127O399_60177 [Vibrio crassostreae]CDT04741.1 hypothetical protein VCRLGP7_180163 [Vibrio crassostreae]
MRKAQERMRVTGKRDAKGLRAGVTRKAVYSHP